MQGMQIKELQEIGIEKSFGLTHPGQTMLNQTLVPNSLQKRFMIVVACLRKGEKPAR